MHWESLTTIDPIEGSVLLFLLLALIWLARRMTQASRADQARRAAAHHAYFHGGGLVRALMARWGKGTPRLTDQRPGDERR